MRVIFLVMVLCVALAGCRRTDEPQRVPVVGKVTYQGQSMAKGEISFVGIQGTQAPASGAAIRDGVYNANARGGVPVGTFCVRVVAFRPVASGVIDPETGRPLEEQYLPAKYNETSELTLTVKPDSKPITKDFELK